MLGLAQACTEKGGRTGKAAVSTDNCIGNKLADEANQLRFAFQRGQQFLQRLQQSYAVLAENVDLRSLASGKFLQILALGAPRAARSCSR